MFSIRIALCLLAFVGVADAQHNPGFIDGAVVCSNYPNPVCQRATPTNSLSINDTFIYKLNVGSSSGGGGSGGIVANAAALAAANIVAAATRIDAQTVVGTFSPTTASCPLTYYLGTTTPAGVYGEVLNTPSGLYWEPAYSTSPVRACQFGTVADGTFNQSTNAVTGTDNTVAIQNALDYAMRYHFQTVCLDDGMYKTTDTLAMGWANNTVYTLSLQACNKGRATYATINHGVTLLPTKIDRCAINVAGGRSSSVKGIQLIGANYAFLANLFRLPPVPTTAAGWLDPLITPGGGTLPAGPGGLNRNSPYAAICIDAYNGTPPAVPYPPQAFPAWTRITAQYGQASSSDTLIENVFIQGFGICVNVQPNFDANGDFTKIINSSCTNSTYGVSIGNSQSRNVSMQNVNCSNVYTFLTNTQFGSLNGELGGNLLNVSCGQLYQLLDVNLAIAGTTVQDTYMEGAVRIGIITGGSITFRNCTYSLYDNVTGQVPPALLETFGTSFRFDDCKFGGSSRITTVVHYTGGTGTVTFNGGTINGGQKVGALFGAGGTNPAGMNALNYTGGFLMGAFTFPNAEFQNRLIWEGQSFGSFMASPSGTTVLSGTSWTRYPVIGSTTRALWSQAMQGFVDGGGESRYWTFLRGPGNQTLDMTGALWTTPLASTGCDTWAGQWSASQQRSQNGLLRPGDIFYHQITGTIWVVESVGTPSPTNYPVVLRQQNNMKVTNTGACLANNLAVMSHANTYQIHVTAAIPGIVYYCDFIAGSTALSNCDRGDKNGSQLARLVLVGDKFWAGRINESSMMWPFAPNATISSVTNGTNSSSGSVILSSAAAKTGRFALLPFPVARPWPCGSTPNLLRTDPSKRTPLQSGSELNEALAC
jgi:hypothetical protein